MMMLISVSEIDTKKVMNNDGLLGSTGVETICAHEEEKRERELWNYLKGTD